MLNFNVKNVEIINKDILKEDLSNEKFKNVKYVLIDPSCSGSGMLNAIFVKNKRFESLE